MWKDCLEEILAVGKCKQCKKMNQSLADSGLCDECANKSLPDRTKDSRMGSNSQIWFSSSSMQGWQRT